MISPYEVCPFCGRGFNTFHDHMCLDLHLAALKRIDEAKKEREKERDVQKDS